MLLSSVLHPKCWAARPGSPACISPTVTICLYQRGAAIRWEVLVGTRPQIRADSEDGSTIGRAWYEPIDNSKHDSSPYPLQVDFLFLYKLTACHANSRPCGITTHSSTELHEYSVYFERRLHKPIEEKCVTLVAVRFRTGSSSENRQRAIIKTRCRTVRHSDDVIFLVYCSMQVRN